MENSYDIDYFISIKKKEEENKSLFDKEKINIIINNILKELEIKEKKDINFVWRRQNALSLSLKKINKDLLNINSEINKLTENKFLIIYENIKLIVLKKNEITKNEKVKYLIDSLLEKCLVQTNFNSLYMCFLKKIYEEKEFKTILRETIKDIIVVIEKIIYNLDELKNETKYKFIDFLKKNKESSKNFIYLSNIYSLLYLYDIINTNDFSNLINNFINKINNFIEKTPVDNNLLEKLVNIFIGLLEYGYLKIKNNINYDKKIELNIKIENILKKKISLRIKFNLKNIFEDLNSNSFKIKKYKF